jgi:hypothetical protein
LFRSVLPLFKKSGRHILKEVKKGGIEVLKDMSNDVDLKTSLKKRSLQGLLNLHKIASGEMEGSGYNRRKRLNSSQLFINTQSKRIKKQSKKKKLKRIQKKKKSKSVRSKKTKRKTKRNIKRKDIFD